MNEKKAYNQLDYSGTYRQDETSAKLTVLGGTYGGRRYLSCKTCYRKTTHPRNANEAQGYAETEVNDTLNIFDNGEMRTPTLIVEEIKAISFQERAGKPGGGKGILIQNEHVGALSTLNHQFVCYDPGDIKKENDNAGYERTIRSNDN